MHGQRKILLAGVVCALLAIGQAAFLLTDRQNYNYTIHVAIGWGVGMAVGLAVLAFHVASLSCSPLVPTSTIVTKYLIFCLLWFIRRKHWAAFKLSINDCTNVQSKNLLKRIKQNADTEYGKDFHFDAISSVDDFIRTHPLTSYEHYVNYIKRVANGELGIMTHTAPSILGKTSGTTGKSKLFPVGAEYLWEMMGSGSAVAESLRKQLGMKSRGALQMDCALLTAAPTSVSDGGIPIGPVTSFLLTDRIKELIFTTPLAGFDIMHEPTSMYVHALFSLRDENLGTIWAPYASSLFLFFRFLEISWHMLVQDIRCGTISDNLTTLRATERKEIEKHLRPMPERANEIERQFRMGFDGIASRLWPHMPVLFAVTSGSMQTFSRRLRKYSKALPIVSGYYACTEGLLGIACEFPEDGQTKYVCIPDGPFYEFIPAAYCDEETPGTLLMEEVKIGECYELVITNRDGLYRYRMGDVIKITGFFDKAPIFQYQYRNGELLNLRSEKTSEVLVTSSLQDTIQKWDDAKLVDYVCTESPLYEEALGKDSEENMVYYVIFVELSMEKSARLMTSSEERRHFQLEFDANLRNTADAYDVYRASNTLGPPRVIFLDPLAFSDFRVHLLETSSTGAGQLKIPRKLRKPEWVSLFLHHQLQYDAAEEV